MIRKRGLQDVKRRNRHVIMQSILENDGLSRVEIAQRTELAPSTVSSLVSELIAEGLLIESGSRTTTAGRSRTGLTINPNYGAIAVIEIGRKAVCMSIFDMALHPLATQTIAPHGLTGNDLLDAIVSAITTRAESQIPLAGIGLLFQEDMRESDFRVMYSTGFASASITLKEALLSQFRVPVIEEYSQVYTVTQALSEKPDAAAANSAHISLGSSVLVSVTLDDRPIPVRGSFYEDTARYLEDLTQEACVEKQQELPSQLGNIITLLCMMFSLNTVFLSGFDSFGKELSGSLDTRLRKALPESSIPRLRFLRRRQPQNWDSVFAQRVRSNILFTH